MKGKAGSHLLLCEGHDKLTLSSNQEGGFQVKEGAAVAAGGERGSRSAPLPAGSCLSLAEVTLLRQGVSCRD